MRWQDDMDATAVQARVIAALDDGEAAGIGGAVDAAMHVFSAAIESLPDPGEPGFADAAAVILPGLRGLESTLSTAARRSRASPAVVLALAVTRRRYNDLMARAAETPGVTLSERTYTAQRQPNLSTQETADGVELRAEQLGAIEVGESTNEDPSAKIESVVATLDEMVRRGGGAEPATDEGPDSVSSGPGVAPAELVNARPDEQPPQNAPALPPSGMRAMPDSGVLDGQRGVDDGHGTARISRSMILLVVVVGVVGCLGWLAANNVDRAQSTTAVRQSSDRPGIAWVLNNLPPDTRLLSDGPTLPAGYSSATWGADGRRWRDFDYFISANTGSAAPDAVRAPVWQSSIAVAVFPELQVRRIVAYADEIRRTRDADRADRLQAATELLQNPGVNPSPEAKTLLARGVLDLRAATALAALAGQLPVRLDDIGVVAAEGAAGMPARVITIRTANPAEAASVLGGLTAAFRPDQVTEIADRGGAVRIHWPLSFTPVPMLK